MLRSPTSEGYCFELIILFVYHAVFQLCELSAVPSVSGSDEITGDALELVYVMSSAVRTLHETFLGILESTVHTTVAVVVH